MDVEIKIKKLRDNAIIPRYQTDGAAGFDFHAAIDHMINIQPGEWRNIPFGIAMEIPKGYEMTIRSRSSLMFNDCVIAYHGLIDSDFRGELSVLLHNSGKYGFVVHPGDRIAQGVIRRHDSAVFVEATELTETTRGSGGFGSTGRE